ncbi:MAG: hypothetical protein WAZ12_00820 [Candidatus Absconditicoccaceae bacterium]
MIIRIMDKENNKKDRLIGIIIIFLMIGITYLFYFLSLYKKENIKDYQTQEKILETQNAEKDIQETINFNTENNTSDTNDVNIEINENIFLENTCNFLNTGNIKFLDIANPDNRIYTPKDTNQIKTTTKSITISGNIEEAYLCIVSDISDKEDSYIAYRKHGTYNTVTKIIFGETRGAINVGYSINNNQFYDSDSSNLKKVSKQLDGKFRTDETPFRYIINLNSVIIADENNGSYNYTPLINELKDGSTINIGGYMVKIGRDDFWASSISYYRLIRKGDGEIILNN